MKILGHHTMVIFVCSLLFLCACKTSQVVSQVASPNNITYLIKGDYKHLTHDKLGHTYLITASNELIKLDKQYKTLFSYSVRQYGQIAHLDVSNPQKILIYFSDYQQIIFLDNTLSEIKQLDLEAMEFWDVTAVSLSRDNFIWLYDPVNVRLVKIDDQGQILLSSNEIYLNDNDGSAMQIIAYDTQVFLCTSETIRIYSEFGGFSSDIQLTNQGIQILDDHLLYEDNGTLYTYETGVQIKNPSSVVTPLPKGIRSYYLYENDGMLVIDDKGLYRLGI